MAHMIKMTGAVLGACIATSACSTHPTQSQKGLGFPPPPRVPSPSASEPSQLTAELKAQTEDAVRAVLKDPKSAEFSSLRLHKHNNLHGNPSWVVCGLVNAKNAFGGYTGAQPFSYDPNSDRRLQVQISAGRPLYPGDISYLVYQNTCLSPARAS